MGKALCPCCGGKVRFGLSGTAERARALSEVVEHRLDPAIDAARQNDLIPIDRFLDFRTQGEQIYEGYIDHIHGRAKAGVTPDVMALNHACSLWVAACDEFSTLMSQPRYELDLGGD